MLIGSKEHYEMMANFEKAYGYLRIDRESRENWRTGQIYEDGEVNQLFHAFSLGYAMARVVYL